MMADTGLEMNEVGSGLTARAGGRCSLISDDGRGRALDFTTLAALWAGPMGVP